MGSEQSLMVDNTPYNNVWRVPESKGFYDHAKMKLGYSEFIQSEISIV